MATNALRWPTAALPGVGGRGSPFGPTLSPPEGGAFAHQRFWWVCVFGCARFSILLGITSDDPEINLRK